MPRLHVRGLRSAIEPIVDQTAPPPAKAPIRVPLPPPASAPMPSPAAHMPVITDASPRWPRNKLVPDHAILANHFPEALCERRLGIHPLIFAPASGVGLRRTARHGSVWESAGHKVCRSYSEGVTRLPASFPRVASSQSAAKAANTALINPSLVRAPVLRCAHRESRLLWGVVMIEKHR